MSYLYNELKMNFYDDKDYSSSSLLDISFEKENFHIFDNSFSNGTNGSNWSTSSLSEKIDLNDFMPKISKESETLVINEFITINIPCKKPVERKKLGRKKKNSGETGLHDEYAQDNLIRKSKKVFSDAILELLNSRITYLNTKGNKLFITIDNKEYEVNKLLNIGQKITKNISVKDNIALFKKEIKNILFQISGKYKNSPKNYNMSSIDEICTNKNFEEIRNILNLDYLDCLKYYRRDKDALNDDNFKCLNGLELIFDQLPQKLEKEGYDKRYEEALINTIKNLETIFYDKKPRKKRKKKGNN